MIIHSIQASNVLKYDKLELHNIPEKGIIAVSGANESGKTAIVETICFALFGRTYSNDLQDITRTIRWGASSCSIEMVFSAGADNSYTVSRSVDKQGMHSAELYRTGEDAPFASGPQAVQDEIIKVCGFDFEQYLDSLYLAQMEITSSASQAETIKGIAGSAPIEAIMDDLRDEISTEHDSIHAIEQEQSRIRTSIEDLDIQEDRLPVIETEKQQFAEQIDVHKEEIRAVQETSTQIREAGTHIQETGHALSAAGRDISIQQWQEQLASVADAIENMRTSVNTLEMETELRAGGKLKKYTETLQARLQAFAPVREQCQTVRSELAAQLGERGSIPQDGLVPLTKQQSRLKRRLISQRIYRGIMKVVLVLAALLTLLLWAGWGLLAQAPDSSLSQGLSNWLGQQSWWATMELSSLLYGAIGASVITLLVFFMATRVGSRIQQGTTALAVVNERLQTTRQQADLLDHIDDRPFPAVHNGLAALDNKQLQDVIEDYTGSDGSIFLSEQSFADHQQKLNGQLDDNANNVASLREAVATRVGTLNRLSEELHDKITRLEREIEDIHARQKEAADLETIIDNMEPALREHRQRVQVRETALKLAAGTCSNIYTHFNQVLSKYTATVMPRLTEGRYKQIQIDDKLRVRVFATEKNDFADLDELSSGTQRQIMLAVRLAISKALVEAGQQGKQFIILDEPFAFFDRERIRNTIKSLPDLDKNISQFWILTQEFESPDQFELSIQCSRDIDELSIG
jgi:DNA repair exonuclease SbcCD ATPase subunit